MKRLRKTDDDLPERNERCREERGESCHIDDDVEHLKAAGGDLSVENEKCREDCGENSPHRL